MSERMSFDEARQALGISDAELEQLVAAGEIPSVKEGDTLYFTREAIERYKSAGKEEATILLSDDDLSLLDEDIDEIDLLGAESETPGETTSVVAGAKESSDLGSADETILNLEGVLEDDSEGTTPIPGAAEGGLGDDTLLDTELLDLGEDADTFDVDTAEDLTLDDITEQGTLLRGGGARVMQMKRKQSHASWTIVMAAAVFVSLIPLAITLQTFYNSSPANAESAPQRQTWIESANVAGGVVEWIADVFAE